MEMLWVVILVALTGSHLGYGSPVRSVQPSYPQDSSGPPLLEGWGSEGSLYAAVPALALVLAAVGLLFGCTWCYGHKDCKPNEGADNQLFTANATHLHDARRTHPPDSGFSEPVNNNISEANNNGPISLREMQNIANNNAAAYIISENEERNREPIMVEPRPRVLDPLEHCADWFGIEDFPRNRLQYLREIGRGWFGRVVEGEIEENGRASSVAVKILNHNASLEDKSRFLDEARVYRDANHENVLGFISKCLNEDPWILILELCSMDLHQYLTVNRPRMAILNEGGVPLQFMCDVTSALSYLHARGYLYGNVNSGNVMVRQGAVTARAVLGCYASPAGAHEFCAPEARRHPPLHTRDSEVWSLGTLLWEVCTWGAPVPPHRPPPPDLPIPYRNHLYQIMQLCWNPDASGRPTTSQVLALLRHLHATHEQAPRDHSATSDFEERWQRLKPNTIPKIDEHIAIVHAPSTSTASHFTGSDHENTTQDTLSVDQDAHTTQDTLSIDMDTAVSRSSSIMSDKDPLSVQIKSESLTNLHGSLEDVRNIYLTHNETAVLECHQGNIILDDNDRSDSSVDPWLKDIIAGSKDDVSYLRDVGDVIKNLDNILNSEKSSSSESSHQASPARDNLSLDCKKEYPVQSCMVKSPGITNFQNILQMSFDGNDEPCEEEVDQDTIGTLSHSFERHSDTASQQTLENLTPDTPVADIDDFSKLEAVTDEVSETADVLQNTELPKEKKIACNDSKLPRLYELCVLSSVSEINHEQFNVRDCELYDSYFEEIRTDPEVITKSIDYTNHHTENKSNVDIAPVAVETQVSTEKPESNETLDIVQNDIRNMEDTLLPETEYYADNKLKGDNCPATETVSNMTIQDENMLSKSIEASERISPIALTDSSVEPRNGEEIYSLEPVVSTRNKTEVVSYFPELTNDKNSEEKLNVTDYFKEQEECNKKTGEAFESIQQIQIHVDIIQTPTMQTPESVQIVSKIEFTDATKNTETKKAESSTTEVNNEDISVLPHETTENIKLKHVATNNEIVFDDTDSINAKMATTIRSDNDKETEQEQSNESTVYLDLTSDTNSKIDKDNTIVSNVGDISKSCLDKNYDESIDSLTNNESTVYLGLPDIVKDTNTFLHSERIICSQNDVIMDNICTSTPKGTNSSADNTLEDVKVHDMKLSETMVSDDNLAAPLTILEQHYFQGDTSPFESPTKSHPTDTYSPVVLSSYENYPSECYKSVKFVEPIELPREELLAFSSNFSEMNLETPSPLRDANFMNEVPDIVYEDLQFDDIVISEEKPDKSEPKTDNTDGTDNSIAKHASPLTPPNSPGTFASAQKYLVDILPNPPIEAELDSDLNSLQKEIDLNQIELQITSKLAMAENENNMNIEYYGPLTVEGLVTEDEVRLGEYVIPEAILAGNGGSVEHLRGSMSDEECVQALRNELELKLPLAQVAAIEPTVESDGEWSELPPPPELVVSYGGAGGALSPIAEETRHQLSAYDNDAWNVSTRTDSSESYPEPCNNSTDEVTELPTGALGGSHDTRTYTVHSNPTYTAHKDNTTSKEITMSADSLSPFKKPKDEIQSPIDDRTFTKYDEEKTNCERLSQVSPCFLSPSTDTSAPDFVENATGVSTLSKTVPTDAKLSQPSELSKATSIDSWCSNDTLYNVEENFDDLAMESDVEHMEPTVDKTFDVEDMNNGSESTDTLTRNDEDKDVSHCSTYIIHESNSEACETFSPDSIYDNYTSKVKTEPTPTLASKSELNDLTKNTETKDLAYGTMPSCSNCFTTGFEDPWKLSQMELVRKSPIGDDVSFTPPKDEEEKKHTVYNDPRTLEPRINKMDSIEISCLQDDLDSQNKTDCGNQESLDELNNSPEIKTYTGTTYFTSTPVTEPIPEDDDFEPISFELPGVKADSISNFHMFRQPAVNRPQGLSSNTSNEHVVDDQHIELQLEDESGIVSVSMIDSVAVADNITTYSDFANSAVLKHQEKHSILESTMNSGDFQQFANSVVHRPQDLSSLIDASCLLLKSEIAASSSTNVDSGQTSQTVSQINHNTLTQTPVTPPFVTNLQESQDIANITQTKHIVTDLDAKEIEPITEVRKEESKNCTHDSNEEISPINLHMNSQSNSEIKIINTGETYPKDECIKSEEMIAVQKINVSHHIPDDAYSEIILVHPHTSTQPPNEEGLNISSIISIGGSKDSSHRTSDSPAVINPELHTTTQLIDDKKANLSEKTAVKDEDLRKSGVISKEGSNESPQKTSASLIEIDPRELCTNTQLIDDINVDIAVTQPNDPSKNDISSTASKDHHHRNFDSLSIDKVNHIEMLRLNEEDLNKNDLLSEEESKGRHQMTFDSHTDELNCTYDSHTDKLNCTYDSHIKASHTENYTKVDEIKKNHPTDKVIDNKYIVPPEATTELAQPISIETLLTQCQPKEISNGAVAEDLLPKNIEDSKINGSSEKFATVNFVNETEEEVVETIVCKSVKNNTKDNHKNESVNQEENEKTRNTNKKVIVNSGEDIAQIKELEKEENKLNGIVEEDKVVTENFLENEKIFCENDWDLPLLRDIRFTGPASEIMSTSFNQDSPTEPTSPECEQDKPDTATDIMKDWDSDTDSDTSDSSSGEFLWKQGSASHASVAEGGERAASPGSGDSGSGSEGDEVEFVPSSWDCRAAPAKSSLRSLEQTPPDSKKRVVFKRQKYHCVYEYPREAAPSPTPAPAPALGVAELSCADWELGGAEDSELGYGQLFGSPSPLDLYTMRAGIAFGADYDEDFFISSSGRPFESLGLMTTSSQFFPGMHVKPVLLDRDLDDEDFPPPPSPLVTTLVSSRTPSLDFTTPDSGVEDITPGSTSTDEDFKTKKLPESDSVSHFWRPVDSGSSSESVSPSSPGGEALGGLRHTRDKLKLDLPPSPHITSPRHSRVFNFVLEKPKRHRDPDGQDESLPLVMTDETPIITTPLPLQKDCEDVDGPEPTFSTFGKCIQKNTDGEQKIILTEDGQEEAENKEESPKAVEPVKGEGTVLDSGDEDSGIESSSKATLERKTPTI